MTAADDEDEVQRLTLDPVLRVIAARMIRNVDPWLVARLWTGEDEPIEEWRDFMYDYWHLRSQARFVLEDRAAPAQAVIAVYKRKREQLAGYSRS